VLVAVVVVAPDVLVVASVVDVVRRVVVVGATVVGVSVVGGEAVVGGASVVGTSAVVEADASVVVGSAVAIRTDTSAVFAWADAADLELAANPANAAKERSSREQQINRDRPSRSAPSSRFPSRCESRMQSPFGTAATVLRLDAATVLAGISSPVESGRSPKKQGFLLAGGTFG
jgi:hypothetical protein